MGITQLLKKYSTLIKSVIFWARAILCIPIYFIVLVTEYGLLRNAEQVEETGLEDAVLRNILILMLVPAIPVWLFTAFFSLLLRAYVALVRVSHNQRVYLTYLCIAPLVTYMALTTQVMWLMFPWQIISIWILQPFFYVFVNQSYSRLNSRILTPLNSADKEIRVLILHPGEKRQPIACTLAVQSVDGPTFEAVSYSWGGHLALRALITVNDRSFIVTNTVMHALQSLRYFDRPRRLWIDQICINQADVSERNHQVQKLMSEIYRRASAVVVWLGTSGPEVKELFRLIHNSMTTELPAPSSLQRKEHKILQGILRRRWWQRMWVLQEIALARKVVLRCGDAEVDWDLFCDFVKSCQERLDIEDNQAQLLKLRRQEFEESEQSLLELVLRFSGRAASDDRDTLFGLHALAKRDAILPDVNYAENVENVFSDFTARVIEETGRLDIFNYSQGDWVWLNWILTDCSWNVKWSSIAESRDARMFWGPESTKVPNVKFQEYAASGSMSAKIKRSPAHKLRICLEGLPVCNIAKLGVSSFLMMRSFNIVANAWIETAGIQDLTDINDERLLSFWQTLSVGAVGEDSPLSYQDIAELMCPGRRFFITEQGWYGLGPNDIRLGDRICIIPGSDVPLVLRKRTSLSIEERFAGKRMSTSDENVFKLVGMCYVPNIMQTPDFSSMVESGQIILQDIWLE